MLLKHYYSVVSDKFKIQLSDSTEFPISEGQTVLAAAQQAGVHLDFSCRDGRCGVCRVKVLAGSAVELNSPESLNDQLRKDHQILTCCHGAESDLSLEAENLVQLEGIETKVLPCRIDSIEHLSTDVMKVVLRLPPNANFQYLSGQYIDIIGSAVRRSYSLASAPKADEAKIELLIRHYSGGVMSQYWFEQAKVNDLLRLEGPLGSFFLRDNDAKQLAFLATGTGIAPVIAMVEELLESGRKNMFEKIVCYFGCRNKDELFFDSKEFFKGAIEFVPVFSREAPAGAHKGYVQQALVEEFQSVDGLSVYACGSPEMIQDARTLLAANGLQENRFYSDAFLASVNLING